MSNFKMGDRVVVVGTILEINKADSLISVRFSDYTLTSGTRQFGCTAVVPEISVDGLAEDTAKRNTIASRANARQVDGDHYKKRGIQPWDYIAANCLDWFTGEIVKYITRWRDKGGVKDLEKARHVLDKYIETEKEKAVEIKS
jgi:hypothetical protein